MYSWQVHEGKPESRSTVNTQYIKIASAPTKLGYDIHLAKEHLHDTKASNQEIHKLVQVKREAQKFSHLIEHLHREQHAKCET